MLTAKKVVVFSRRRILILGPVVVVLFAALAYFAVVPGFDVTESPVAVQGVYYGVLGTVGRIDLRPTSEFMVRTHEATRVNPGDSRTPYTFKYTDQDIETIAKDSRRCRACHGSMLQRSGGEPRYPLHKAMMTARLIYFECTDCHKKVDLGRRHASRATIRVDRTQCIRCHEEEQEPEGTEFMSVRSREREKIPSQYLISNHGFNKKDAKKWVSRHANVAPVTGVEKCRRCHKAGTELDFCNECHGQSAPALPSRAE